jgi:hypothetical protein
MEYEKILENFVNNIYDKMLIKTGLDEELLMWYHAVTQEANPNDNSVLYENIRENIVEKTLYLENDSRINKKLLYKYIDEQLPTILEIFKEKNLIDYQLTETGEMVPRLIGYNYQDDPEFYIACRKIGKTNWNMKLPRCMDVSEVSKYYLLGYEFSDKTFTNVLFN